MNKGVKVFLLVILATLAYVAFPVFALEPPVITLERVDVASIQPFFVKPRVGYKDEKETGKDLPVGSILNTAYIFNIKNPNKEAVMLDEMTFTIAFDGYDVNTALVYEDQWIPPGKTNQLRVVVTNEALPTMGALTVAAPNVARMQEMKTTAAELVKKWWENIGDFTFPITISGGTAIFRDEKGKEVRSTFTGKFGGEEKK